MDPPHFHIPSSIMASTSASMSSSVDVLPLLLNISPSTVLAKSGPFIGCKIISRIQYVNTVDHNITSYATPPPYSVFSTSFDTITATTHPETMALTATTTTITATDIWYPLFVPL